MTRPNAWLAIAIIAVFGPNLVHVSEAAIGAGSSDALKHVWSQWIVHQNIGAGDPFAMDTTLIHHPDGGAFFSLDTVNAWLGFPLRGLFGSVVTYNVVVMLNIFAAAFAASWLARILGFAAEAQWLAGFAFAVSAWTLCFPLASGVSETAAFWPLPLIAVAAIQTWKRASWAWPVCGGILLIVQGLACWSHGITAGLMLGLMAIGLHQRLRSDPDRMIRFAVFLGTALLISIPLYAAVSGTVSADDAVKVRTLSLFHSSPLNPLDVPEANSMALIDFVLPGSWGRRVSQAGTEQLNYAAYPGWCIVLLGALAVKTKQRGSRWILAGALFFAFMSMGPRIYIDHARSMVGFPNPIYLLTYWLVPLVNATIHSVDRFAVGVQLCAVLLAGLGLTQLSMAKKRIALAVVFAETLLISPGRWPVPMVEATEHPVSTHIRDSPQSGAVIDIPYMSGDASHSWFNGDVFLQQTVHGQPIPFQLEGHGIETAHPNVASNAYFQALSADRAPEQPCDGVASLAQMDFGWVVLRQGASSAVESSLETCLTPIVDTNGRRLFRIPSVP